MLSDFDIFAAAGAKDKAVVEQFTATADSNGAITASFVGVSGAKYGQVNGIEVLSGSTQVLTVNAGDPLSYGITIDPTTFTNQGTVSVSNGENLSIQGAWSNASGASITATDATLSLGDQYASSTNAWSNAGTITANNATVNLGGAITQNSLGTFNRTIGTVNLVGTLDDTGSTLALNAATGSWSLAGGTIKNGSYSARGARTGLHQFGWNAGRSDGQQQPGSE